MCSAILRQDEHLVDLASVLQIFLTPAKCTKYFLLSFFSVTADSKLPGKETDSFPVCLSTKPF